MYFFVNRPVLIMFSCSSKGVSVATLNWPLSDSKTPVHRLSIINSGAHWKASSGIWNFLGFLFGPSAVLPQFVLLLPLTLPLLWCGSSHPQGLQPLQGYLPHPEASPPTALTSAFPLLFLCDSLPLLQYFLLLFKYISREAPQNSLVGSVLYHSGSMGCSVCHRAALDLFSQRPLPEPPIAKTTYSQYWRIWNLPVNNFYPLQYRLCSSWDMMQDLLERCENGLVSGITFWLAACPKIKQDNNSEFL